MYKCNNVFFFSFKSFFEAYTSRYIYFLDIPPITINGGFRKLRISDRQYPNTAVPQNWKINVTSLFRRGSMIMKLPPNKTTLTKRYDRRITLKVTRELTPKQANQAKYETTVLCTQKGTLRVY